MEQMGKMIIVAGVVMVAAGSILLLAQKVPFIGKLPGDIIIKKDNFTFYFPLATCVLISLLLTLISMLWTRK